MNPTEVASLRLLNTALKSTGSSVLHRILILGSHSDSVPSGMSLGRADGPGGGDRASTTSSLGTEKAIST